MFEYTIEVRPAHAEAFYLRFTLPSQQAVHEVMSMPGVSAFTGGAPWRIVLEIGWL